MIGRARLVVITSTLISVLSLSAGCSTDRSSVPAAPSSTANSQGADNQAGALLRSSSEATKTLATAHVVIVFQGQFSRLGQVSKIDGDAQASPLIANGMVTYQNGEVAPFVLAGDTVSVEVGGVWNAVGATSALIPSAIIDPHQGLPNILNSVKDPQSAGSEIIDGTDTAKVTGTLPAEQATEILPDASGPADFTAWIRKAGDPVLVRMALGFNPGQSLTATFSNWNIPVHVTAAPAT